MPLFAKRLLPPQERGDRKDREEAGGDSCRCGPGPGDAGFSMQPPGAIACWGGDSTSPPPPPQLSPLLP